MPASPSSTTDKVFADWQSIGISKVQCRAAWRILLEKVFFDLLQYGASHLLLLGTIKIYEDPKAGLRFTSAKYLKLCRKQIYEGSGDDDSAFLKSALSNFKSLRKRRFFRIGRFTRR